MKLGGRVQLKLMGAFAASRASRWNRRAMEPAFAMRPGRASQGAVAAPFALGQDRHPLGTRARQSRWMSRGGNAMQLDGGGGGGGGGRAASVELGRGRGSRCDVRWQQVGRAVGRGGQAGRRANSDGATAEERRAAAGVRWQRLEGQLSSSAGGGVAQWRRGGSVGGGGGGGGGGRGRAGRLGAGREAGRLVPMTPDVWLAADECNTGFSRTELRSISTSVMRVNQL
ncbi:hypothetical protein PMIN01_11185 [Paraphaeosphaeria minitans]|uniref:Uncharacterized protein n=1 Tax=Paraphaeosphaeria minitans TaxID=565426 RepID=A0A9P6KL58_9PLEO|nr:hypothetical protein PMIN01_11185 [Paraphaeosphaeria minitans]